MTNLKYFSKSEFKCGQVNCYDKMDRNLLEMLDVARGIAGVPFKINSSWRDEETNRKVGGKSNSSHLRGNAVDIHCNNSQDRLLIIDSLITAGFSRIGIAKTFIHCDVDENLPQNVMWLY